MRHHRKVIVFCVALALFAQIKPVVSFGTPESSADSGFSTTDYGLVLTETMFSYKQIDQSGLPFRTIHRGDFFFIRNTIIENNTTWHEVIMEPGIYEWLAEPGFIQVNHSLKPVMVHKSDSTVQAKTGLVDYTSTDLDLNSIRIHIDGYFECIEDSIRSAYFRVYPYDRSTGPNFVRVGDIELDLAAVFLQAAEFLSGLTQTGSWAPHRNSETAFAFLDLVKTRFPDTVCPDPYGFLDSHYSGVKAYQTEAMIHTHVLKNPEHAVAAYSKIVDLYHDVRSGIGLSGGWAKLEMARILGQDLDEFDRAEKLFFDLIRSYAGLEISGFEWNNNLDIAGMDGLLELAVKRHLSQEQQIDLLLQIQSVSHHPVVLSLTHFRIADIRIDQNDHPLAIEEYFEVIRRYPDSVMHWDLAGCNFGPAALDMIVSIQCNVLDTPDVAISLTSDLQSARFNKRIRDMARMLHARCIDEYGGRRESVIDEYERINQDRELSEGFALWPIWENSIYKQDLVYRGLEIQQFKPFPATPKLADALVFNRVKIPRKVISTLPTGKVVQVLYESIADGKVYCKIEYDDVIGWISSENLEQVN